MGIVEELIWESWWNIYRRRVDMEFLEELVWESWWNIYESRRRVDMEIVVEYI